MLVTGAAGGIGAAVAAGFVAAGAQVVAADLPGRAAPGGVRAALGTDLSDPAACTALVGAAVDRLGGLDVVAHLAGVMRRRADLADVTEDDWDVQHDVNLKSAFFLLRAAAEQMRRQGGGGRLVAAASQGWWSGGYGGSAVYASTKGGLVSLCRGLARTYGPDGITVNTVAPGAIDTPMLTTDLAPGALDSIVEATPLGRVGTPAEVASAVLFLSSARASFITAATLNVSGGWLAY
ncbi:SDR family NAD(P)-dependent oxidoreductase [Streptomyces sp. CA-111067]|uniref:SDR family NAD(P)-dependent oxidoreductase n=1 Tax=Streptomyces sp. CA-111067 TaxID=3240046 RepID=UPI003D98FB9A